MTGVRIYDPAQSGRVYVHTDPTTGRLSAGSTLPAGNSQKNSPATR